MPIYEYICGDCSERYEQIVLSRTQAIACPKCSSRSHTLQLSVFSAPAKSSNGDKGVTASPASVCCGSGGCGCR
jgi:putative FmdB family regulatory protein